MPVLRYIPSRHWYSCKSLCSVVIGTQLEDHAVHLILAAPSCASLFVTCRADAGNNGQYPPDGSPQVQRQVEISTKGTVTVREPSKDIFNFFETGSRYLLPRKPAPGTPSRKPVKNLREQKCTAARLVERRKTTLTRVLRVPG